MLKASFVMTYHLKNKVFDILDRTVNRDNCSYYAYHLKKEFEKYNIDLSTHDINPIETSDIVIYNDIPKILPKAKDKSKSYLILFESEVIKPENFLIENHKYFNKIFTWHDHLIDNIKYFKINFSHKFPTEINRNVEKEKFCTLIAGNKRSKHPLELYSKRIEAINWYEKHHNNLFEFYGIGWDKYQFISNKLNNIKPLIKVMNIFAPNYSTYKGKIDSKYEVLKKYKFAICYENAKDISGYITEKIFDCFFAGCVPIYWGANNILDHIPANCFIDKRLFEKYEDLHLYLTQIDNTTYSEYIENIELYIKSKQANIFSTNYFVETIIKEVVL